MKKSIFSKVGAVLLGLGILVGVLGLLPGTTAQAQNKEQLQFTVTHEQKMM